MDEVQLSHYKVMSIFEIKAPGVCGSHFTQLQRAIWNFSDLEHGMYREST